MNIHNHKKIILVIDDDRIFCDAVSELLSSNTAEVLSAHTAADGLMICSRTRVDVVLLDQKLPDGEGHTLCPSILRQNDQTKIIFITAYPNFKNAVAAIKQGAYDYLSKPFDLEELRLAIEQSLRVVELEKVEQLHKFKNDKEREEAVLIGNHMGIAGTKRLVELAATSDAPVLITGETGTGKNVVAKSIHYKGPARGAAFISINCSSLPENLIEMELFGSEKGAFTGAVGKKGIFEMAEGGTLLLDEIGEMSLHLQSKLLGVLEDKKIRRLGGETIRPVDVRIIAATNKDMESALRGRTFREDLYYRLNVIRIHIPPLRERRQDIPALCEFFIKGMAGGREAGIPDSEVSVLMEYDWPGNVRELKNIMERALLLQKGPSLRPSELLGTKGSSAGTLHTVSQGSDLMTLRQMEKNYIKCAFEKHSGNYTRTAAALGISLSTMKKKVKDYGLK